ncbi:hypothetical protein H5410_057112 [Solanum commersonii]|uniref:Uncharacterized protein n=1 Tax=Solanum commersonii TaxID=4109 RepID=A0A9J5WN59_SOLCO|nr:hypothetical protein H5410_057112 [Solanum commersonii]
MLPNDFGDSRFVCLITVSCLPSAPSHSRPLGSIGFAYWNKWRSKSLWQIASVLGDAQGVSNSAKQESKMNIHNKIEVTYAHINCVLKHSSCDTPLPEILMLAILATCASSSSTKSI